MTSDSLVERYLPEPLVRWKLMDTPIWCWIALVMLIAAVAAVSRWASWLALVAVGPVLKRIAPRIHPALLTAFVGPLRLLLVAIGMRAGIEWLGLAAPLRLYLERGATLLLFCGLAWLSMAVTDSALLRLRDMLGAKHQTFAQSVLPLASRALKIIILTLTAAAILSNWGYNATTIVAGLGVGGVAVALAAQKTIENLFGGVAVITDRPVAVGEFCRFGERVGTVEDIGLRSTRIRTLDRTLVIVPNGQFSTMTLENFSKRDKMWFHFMLNLRRDTTPDQVRELLQSITRALTEHPKAETGPLPVRFVGVGTYSLDLEVFAYITTRDGDEFLKIQQELFLRILDEVEAAGTALAVPTQAYYSIGPSQGTAPVPDPLPAR